MTFSHVPSPRLSLKTSMLFSLCVTVSHLCVFKGLHHLKEYNKYCVCFSTTSHLICSVVWEKSVNFLAVVITHSRFQTLQEDARSLLNSMFSFGKGSICLKSKAAFVEIWIQMHVQFSFISAYPTMIRRLFLWEFFPQHNSVLRQCMGNKKGKTGWVDKVITGKWIMSESFH